MRIKLPSNGAIGFKSVNLRQPTHRDMLAMRDFDDNDIVVKTEFIRRVIDVDVESLTIYDRDYLYNIALSSICVSGMTFTISHCGKGFEYKYNLGECDVYEYNGGNPITVLGGLKLHIPTVKDELFSYNFVIDNLGDFDYTTFENVLSLRCVEDERLDYSSIKSLEDSSEEIFDDNEWIAILSWVKLCFHGLNQYLDAVCPFCGKKFRFRATFGGNLCNVGTEEIMNRYKVSEGVITYNEYLDMTISEFLTLISNNKEV